MKAWLFLIAALLIIPRFAFAQETPTPTEWTIEQRCVTTFTEPPDGWTFDGVIFSFIRGDGVHALRNNLATSYYVAFDNFSEFGVAGSLSPDGRWFAVPVGSAERNDNLMQDYDFYVNEIRFYETNPSRTFISLPLYANTFYASATVLGVSPVYWLGEDQIIAKGALAPQGTLLSPNYESEVANYVIDRFEQGIVPSGLPNDAEFISASPDNERWIYVRQIPEGRETHLNVRRGMYLAVRNMPEEAMVIPITSYRNALSLLPIVQWTADSSQFAAFLEDQSSIGIFDRDGNLLDAIEADGNMPFSLNSESIAYVSPELTIRIANLRIREVLDTCIEAEFGFENGLSFSPNGDQLAFATPQRDWVYILDLEAWEAYRINLAAADIIGWHPIE